jgi:hypothetical protein
MLNLKTNRILKTRDVIWMKKQYGDYKKIKKGRISKVQDNDDETVITASSSDLDSDSEDSSSDSDSDSDSDSSTDSDSENSEDGRDDDSSQTGRESGSSEEDDDTPINPKLQREMKRLGGWFNPTATKRATRATIIDDIAESQSGRESEAESAHILIDRFDLAFLSVEADPGDYDQLIEPLQRKRVPRHVRPQSLEEDQEIRDATRPTLCEAQMGHENQKERSLQGKTRSMWLQPNPRCGFHRQLCSCDKRRDLQDPNRFEHRLEIEDEDH